MSRGDIGATILNLCVKGMAGGVEPLRLEDVGRRAAGTSSRKICRCHWRC
jgi:hypothetical protein